jgi:SAM-dependent methyltransferase
LPQQGSALELACGLGGNALLLASHGLDTKAWDISDVAINKLQAYVKKMNVALFAEIRDVVVDPPETHSFDVIVVSHFLDRSLAPQLVSALNPGGLLFYQSFIQDAVSLCGPQKTAYRLRSNELLSLFASLKVLVYREEARVGDINRGFRDEALFVGLKL